MQTAVTGSMFYNSVKAPDGVMVGIPRSQKGIILLSQIFLIPCTFKESLTEQQP